MTEIYLPKIIAEEKHYCKKCKKDNICLRMIDNLGTEFVKCKKCNLVLFIEKW